MLGRSCGRLIVVTTGKSTITTSAPACSSAAFAAFQRSMIEARVMIFCPVGPPIPMFQPVPASRRRIDIHRRDAKRFPASDPIASACTTGATCATDGNDTHGWQRQKSPRVSGSSCTKTSRDLQHVGHSTRVWDNHVHCRHQVANCRAPI